MSVLNDTWKLRRCAPKPKIVDFIIKWDRITPMTATVPVGFAEFLIVDLRFREKVKRALNEPGWKAKKYKAQPMTNWLCEEKARRDKLRT